jgi:hypothetical protein
LYFLAVFISILHCEFILIWHMYHIYLVHIFDLFRIWRPIVEPAVDHTNMNEWMNEGLMPLTTTQKWWLTFSLTENASFFADTLVLIHLVKVTKNVKKGASFSVIYMSTRFADAPVYLKCLYNSLLMTRNLNHLKCVRFGVFTMITLKFIIFWDVMVYSLVEIYKFF